MAAVANTASLPVCRFSDVSKRRDSNTRFSFSSGAGTLVSFQRHLSQSRTLRRLLSVNAVGVPLGGEKGQAKAAAGAKIKVTKPVKVYHVPKIPEFNLEGLEGELKEVLGVWKGVEVSANLPYKVQFLLEKDGAVTKFLAHLTEDEFDVL